MVDCFVSCRYYSYVVENPNTLLVHMLGMYRVKMNHLRRKVRFVIMNSVFDTPEKIHRIYDLKGSLIGREITKKEREKGGVFKDLGMYLAVHVVCDFIRIHVRRFDKRKAVLPSGTEEGRVYEANRQGRRVSSRTEHHGLLAAGD